MLNMKKTAYLNISKSDEEVALSPTPLYFAWKVGLCYYSCLFLFFGRGRPIRYRKIEKFFCV